MFYSHNEPHIKKPRPLFFAEYKPLSWYWHDISDDKLIFSLFLFFFISGVSIRLYHLSSPMTYDEAFYYVFRSASLRTVFFLWPTSQPLNNLLTLFFAKTIGIQEWSLRLGVFIFSIGTIILTWVCSRLLLSRLSAFITTALVCYSEYLIAYSVNARSYGTMVFFALGSFYLAHAVTHKPTPKNFLWLAVVLSLGIFAHPSMAIWYIVICLIITGNAIFSKNQYEITWQTLVLNLFIIPVIFTLLLYSPFIIATGMEKEGSKFFTQNYTGITSLIISLESETRFLFNNLLPIFQKGIHTLSNIDFFPRQSFIGVLKTIPSLINGLFFISTNTIFPTYWVLVGFCILGIIGCYRYYGIKGIFILLGLTSSVIIFLLINRQAIPYRRFFIYFIPFIYMLLALGFETLSVITITKLSKWKDKIYIIIPVTFSLLLVVTTMSSPILWHNKYWAIPAFNETGVKLPKIAVDLISNRKSNTAFWWANHFYPVMFYYRLLYQFENPENPEVIYLYRAIYNEKNGIRMIDPMDMRRNWQLFYKDQSVEIYVNRVLNRQ